MTQAHVQRVESTIKGGVDIELALRTVIVGPNGAGKTAIVQAIELATQGAVTDMEGRDRVKENHALSRLFPSGTGMVALANAASPMVAKVTMSDGVIFSWEMERGKKKGTFKKPVPTRPSDFAWPIQDLISTLGGGTSTVQSWLEEQVLGTLADTDVIAAVPASVQTEVKWLLKENKSADFMAMGKLGRDTARKLRAEATREETTIDKMVEGVPAALLESEREAMEAELVTLRVPQTEGITQGQYDTMRAELDGLVERYLGFKGSYEGMPDGDPKANAAAKKLAVIDQLLDLHNRHFETDTCWTCGTEGIDLAARAVSIREAKEQLGSVLSEATDKLRAKTAMDNTETEMTALAERVKAAVVIQVGADNGDRVGELTRQLGADETASQAWKNAESARAECKVKRERADKLAAAAKELEKAGRSLLDRKKAEFEKKVTDWLPEGDELGVDLKTSRVGLKREDALHSALSGGESNRVLLALAAAVGRGSTPSVLAPPDRGWDRDTLTSVMEAMSGSSAQILLMSTVEPEAVEGWSVITL